MVYVQGSFCMPVAVNGGTDDDDFCIILYMPPDVKRLFCLCVSYIHLYPGAVVIQMWLVVAALIVSAFFFHNFLFIFFFVLLLSGLLYLFLFWERGWVGRQREVLWVYGLNLAILQRNYKHYIIYFCGSTAAIYKFIYTCIQNISYKLLIKKKTIHNI